MLETSEQVIIEALTEALETMAFMMVMPPEDELPTPTTSIKATMDFIGPVRGCVELMAPQEFTQTMAANVLGVDSEDDEAVSKCTDAFKELINTTCGVLTPKLGDTPADVFDFSIPQAEHFTTAADWETFIAQTGVTVLDVDGYPVAARLTIS
ncbi:MAG: chemotaxis protein CheX [Planctomycetes bacterium]|nr:chemotaxis protein CheX [Planctomycetota bacterium]